jgi:hypothetical protein
MSSRIARSLGLGAGLAAVALLCAAQANAAGTWTVKAGSAASGSTVAITGRTAGTSPQIHFNDVTANLPLTCASGTAPGSVKVGKGLGGSAIGHITGSKTTWKTCAGPAGLKFVVTGSNTWNLNASSFASGVTTGSISNVKARVVDSGVCAFTVTGKVAARYSNKTHNLTIPGTSASLTISNVSSTANCLGLIKNNDKASFKGTYALKANSAANNPITITHS